MSLTTGPAGATIATAQAIAPLSLTPAQPTVDLTGGDAWWKFTASQSAVISFDTLLSTYPDGYPAGTLLDITVYTANTPTPTTLADLIIDRDRTVADGQLYLRAVAGTTYYVNANWPFAEPALLRLRVSDYGEVTDWVQAADQVHVINGPSDLGVPGTPSWNIEGDINPIEGTLTGWASGYEGRWQFTRAFGGPNPGDDDSAIDCAWSHARRANSGDTTGGSYWSDDGGATWHGSGSCPVIPPAARYNSAMNLLDHPVGFNFTSTAADDVHQSVQFRVWGQAQWVNLHGIRARLGSEAGTATLTNPTLQELADEGKTNVYGIDWEADHCDLLDVAAAPDELGSGGASVAGADGLPLKVDWYYSRYTPDNHTAAWGPHRAVNEGDYDWTGAADGPEKYTTPTIGTTGQLAGALPLASGYHGGPSDWVSLDTHWSWNDEEASLDGSGALPPAGLVLVCLPEGITTDGNPPAGLGPFPALNVSRAQYREYAFCALRITARPARYRVQLLPEIPGLGQVQPPLRQYPRTDGLGASSTRRAWPPSRSLQGSNRQVGGYL